MAIAVPPNFGNGCFPHCWSVTGPAGSGSPDHSRVVLATVLAPRLAAGDRGSLGQGQLLLVPINVLLYVARIIGGAVEVSSADLECASSVPRVVIPAPTGVNSTRNPPSTIFAAQAFRYETPSLLGRVMETASASPFAGHRKELPVRFDLCM